MTQFGGRGGRGAEQQCRKRRGSSEDGGVTPLKVKQLNYHTNGRCFSSSGTSRVSTENTFAFLLLWRVEGPSVIWRWGVRNALFVQLRNGRCFSQCVLFFFPPSRLLSSAGTALRCRGALVCSSCARSVRAGWSRPSCSFRGVRRTVPLPAAEVSPLSSS